MAHEELPREPRRRDRWTDPSRTRGAAARRRRSDAPCPGEVAQIGEGVTRVAVGDRVTASIFPRWIDGRFAAEYTAQLGGSLDGMLTEYAILDEDALVHFPDHLSFEEAACLPCAAV